MTPAQAIARSPIEAATRQLVACSEFEPRLGWWLQRGHSSERWIQFEWAYQLQQEVSPEFAVPCEHRRLDVSLVRNAGPYPFCTANPVAGVELKWWGNWWVDKRAVNELEGDLKKVHAPTGHYPAVALLLFLLVEPIAKDKDPVRAWIQEQIDNGKGVTDIPTLRRRLSTLSRSPDFEFNVKVACGSSFANASLHGFAFSNEFARGESAP